MASPHFSTTQMDNRGTRQSFLVTYSNSDLSLFPTRESFGVAVAEAFDFGPAESKVKYWACAREPHEHTSGFHYHVSLLMSKPKRWTGVKKHLSDQYGIVVNFSTSHNMYYFAFKYVTKSDTDFVTSDLHPPLESIATPQTSKSVKASRRSSVARAAKKSAARQLELDPPEQNGACPTTKVPRLDKFGVIKFIRKESIKDGDHLYNVAEARSIAGNDDLARFLATQNRRSVDDLFECAERLATAKAPNEKIEPPRMEVIRRAATDQCIAGCNQQWLACALEVLANNRVNPEEFAFAIRDLLTNGRGKRRNILLIGKSNCAKTFLLDPIRDLFNTYTNAGNNKYTWQDAADCSVMFLNDFRWSPEIISWADLLLLLEGHPVRFPTPKNHCARDILFTKDAPVFATSEGEIKFSGSYGRSNDQENEMMRVRWKIYKLFYQIPDEEIITMKKCPRCFANLVLMGDD